MAAVFGRIDEFDSKKEDWPQYVERLDHFFAANGIAGVPANFVPHFKCPQDKIR